MSDGYNEKLYGKLKKSRKSSRKKEMIYGLGQTVLGSLPWLIRLKQDSDRRKESMLAANNLAAQNPELGIHPSGVTPEMAGSLAEMAMRSRLGKQQWERESVEVDMAGQKKRIPASAYDDYLRVMNPDPDELPAWDRIDEGAREKLTKSGMTPGVFNTLGVSSRDKLLLPPEEDTLSADRPRLKAAELRQQWEIYNRKRQDSELGYGPPLTEAESARAKWLEDQLDRTTREFVGSFAAPSPTDAANAQQAIDDADIDSVIDSAQGLTAPVPMNPAQTGVEGAANRMLDNPIDFTANYRRAGVPMQSPNPMSPPNPYQRFQDLQSGNHVPMLAPGQQGMNQDEWNRMKLLESIYGPGGPSRGGP